MKLLKKLTFWIFIAVFFVSQSTMANPKSLNRTMDITVYPISLIVGRVPLRFSFAVADRVALGINLAGVFFGLGESKVLGVSGGVDAKFYLTGRVYEDGWYARPGVFAGYLDIARVNGAHVGLDVAAGYGWVWASGFSLDLGLALDYGHWFAKHDTAGIKNFGLFGFTPLLDLNLGFAF
ncbi:MAG TPA: hypothetical protein VEL47_08160 [Myxococcota bacterium]|nr:hypothetical protein [Myxococcota bacterium]